MGVSRWRTLWKVLVAAVAALIIVIDIVAFVGWGGDATLSGLALDTALVHPTLPLVVGFVLGHLFWPQRLPAIKEADKP